MKKEEKCSVVTKSSPSQTRNQNLSLLDASGQGTSTPDLLALYSLLLQEQEKF